MSEKKLFVNCVSEERDEHYSFDHFCVGLYEDDDEDAVCWISDDLPDDERERYAKLFAAAPALLGLVKEVMSNGGLIGIWDEWMEKAGKIVVDVEEKA